MNKTIEEIFAELESIIGEEISYNDIICAFGDYEENGNDYVHVERSHSRSNCHIAYIDGGYTEFTFIVDDDDCIIEVYMDDWRPYSE